MISSNFVFILSAILFALLVAGFLIFVARVRKPKPIVIERYLPKAKKLKLSDCEINYYHAGKGSNLLLIHGLGASGYIWRFIFKALSKRYTVTALDLPGFGQSSKNPQASYNLDNQSRRVLELLAQLNINKVQIVGSSMGGAIGLWLARIKPSLVNNVIALAPATNKKLVKVTLDRFISFTGPLSQFVGPKIVKSITKLVLYDKTYITDEDYKTYAQPYVDDKNAYKTLILATHVITDERLPHELSGIECPVTLVWGNKDKMIPKKIITELEAIIPESKVIVLDKVGHHPMEESPAKVVKVLMEQLN